MFIDPLTLLDVEVKSPPNRAEMCSTPGDKSITESIQVQVHMIDANTYQYETSKYRLILKCMIMLTVAIHDIVQRINFLLFLYT